MEGEKQEGTGREGTGKGEREEVIREGKVIKWGRKRWRRGRGNLAPTVISKSQHLCYKLKADRLKGAMEKFTT